MQFTKQQPHRPGPLHQSNKKHKGGRHASKSSATSEIRLKAIAKSSAIQRREDRLNKALQNRRLKREKAVEEKRKLGSDVQPPLLIGVLDLYENTCKSLFDSIKSFDDETVLRIKGASERCMYVVLPKLKTRFRFIALDSTKFDESLDLMKTIDLLMLFDSPLTVNQDEDYFTRQLLRAIHIHCLPTMVHVLDGRNPDGGETLPAKDILNAKRVLKARAGDEKVHCIERPQDFVQLFHTLGTCKRQKSQFKEMRPTVVTDKVEVLEDCLTFTGFVRNKNLSPNDLVHVVGFDDFQIKKIDVLADPVSLRAQSKEALELVETLVPEPMRQETLEQENAIDPMEGEQTWPTADELAAAVERKNTKRVLKKLPPGTSEYQGAWIPDDSDEDKGGTSDDESDDEGVRKMDAISEDDESASESDNEEEEEEDDLEFDREHAQGSAPMELEDYDKTHNVEKEMKILDKLKEARLEEMFPDEVDTPQDLAARVRFARFRGLKSFRTSPWDSQENLPPEYGRIYQFQNFKSTRRRVIDLADTQGANPGLYVRVYLASVPSETVSKILAKQVPPTLVGLLKYERKMTTMNLLIKRLPDSNHRNPVQSKEELIFYVGFRKFKARPLFSAHSIASKFKYERFLRDDVAMVATLYAPIAFPPAPVLVFRALKGGQKELVASGSVLDSNPNRLIVKRIRLSGHPFKIHSKTAVIRFMFFNSEDVHYFKPVELTSKYNRRGHITEPLGTHGHMKCTFDKKIRSDDCIFMNLYKRVFPKWSYRALYDS